MKVFFLCQNIGLFIKQYPVYLMLKSLKINVKVVVVPHKQEGVFSGYTVLDIDKLMLQYELEDTDVMKAFTIDEGDGNTINPVDLTISEKPDFVFFATPYDSQRYKEHTIEYISKISKTCYIPYGFVSLSIDEMQFQLRELHLLDYIFCETKFHFSKFRAGGIQRKNLFISGYPIFDLKSEYITKYTEIKKNNDLITVSYYPRWTLDYELIPGTFMVYYHFILSIQSFIKNKIELIFRAHSLSFDNLVSNKFLSNNDVIDIKQKFDKDGLVYDDANESHHLKSMLKSDYIILDYTSIIPEAIYFNKKIILINNGLEIKDNFNKFGKRLFYFINYASSPDEILNIFDKNAGEKSNIKKFDMISKALYKIKTCRNIRSFIRVQCLIYKKAWVILHEKYMQRTKMFYLKNTVYGLLTYNRIKAISKKTPQEILPYRNSPSEYICEVLMKENKK